MSMFDQAKEKAEQFVDEAKEKFGQRGERETQDREASQGQNGNQYGESQGQDAQQGMNQMREQGAEAFDNAREQYGQQQ